MVIPCSFKSLDNLVAALFAALLKALEVYNKLELPTWGQDLSELNMNEIATYVRPKSKLNN